ncbi:impdh [Symbiodinium sp. CCMP2592]|nr:impdh [Symbiodinium sp. CCMP2592]
MLDSFNAEVAAAIIGECWSLALPQGLPVTIWCDCSAVCGLLQGTMSAKNGASCVSLAQRLRFVAQLQEHRPGACGKAEWLPGHCGNPFNEFVDRVAKAGARQQLHQKLPAAFWQLLQHDLLAWAWLTASRNPAFPTLEALASGQYEQRDAPPDHCWPKPIVAEAPPCVAKVAFRVVSCNVQTLKNKRQLIWQQLASTGAGVIGLQETRSSREQQVRGQVFFEFSTAALKGEGGCSLLFNRVQPYAHQGKQPLFFQMEHFTCLHASPQCLAIKVQAPVLQAVFVAAHAPTSAHSLAVRTQWWTELAQFDWVKAYSGRVILLVDANAQVGSVVSDSIGCHAGSVENSSGALFRDWATEVDFFVPSTHFDSAGDCVPSASEGTWVSPSGCECRLDYIAFPMSWRSRGLDHFPVVVDVSFEISDRLPVRRQSEAAFVRDPDEWPAQAVAHLAHRIDTLVPAAWETNVHAHTEELFFQVLALGASCKPVSSRRCRAFVSEASKWWLEATKFCKKAIKNWSALAARLDSQRSSGRTGLSAEGWDLLTVRDMVSFACSTLATCRKELRRCLRVDKGAFVRRAHAKLCDVTDPFNAKEFFKTLRALRPPCKRVIKPYAALQVADCIDDSFHRRLIAQQEHFASLEAGTKCAIQDVLVPAPDPAGEARFSRISKPVKKGKAPGPEGIPDWLWALRAGKAAQLLLPLCLKTHVRLLEPIKLKSTQLIALFKGGSPSKVESFRAIALMAGPGKLIRKQLRSSALIKALPATEFQQGGLPGSLLQGAHHVLRTHLALAHSQKVSSAAIFMDVSSAYYRVVRQALTGDVENDEQVCQVLGLLGVQRESMHAVCEWLAGTHLLQQASPHSQRILAEFLRGTHFSLRGSADVYRTQAGTRPGDALADVLFAMVQADCLAAVEKRLDAEGLLSDPVTEAAFAGSKLVAPTWADDTVLLQVSASAEQQLAKTTRTMAVLHEEFLRRAMLPNCKRGKTEILFAFRGRQAPALRQLLLSKQGGVLRFSVGETSISVCCVKRYVHLGGHVTERPGAAADILQHVAAATAAIRPLRSAVLRDDRIPLTVRKLCLSSLALSTASSTAATWSRLTLAEANTWKQGYIKLLRSLSRDDRFTGCPSLPGEKEVCRHFRMPSPHAFLRVQRLRHFQRLVLTQPSLLDLLVTEYRLSPATSWLGLLQDDAHWLQSLTSVPEEARLFPEGLAEWSLYHPAAFRTATRHASLALHHPLYDPAWVAAVASDEPAPAKTWPCDCCDAAFASQQQLAAHRFAVHGRHCEARRITCGTTCHVCCTRFWTRARLIRHLQHDSPKCLSCLVSHQIVERAEDVAAPDPALAALPSTKLIASALLDDPAARHAWKDKWVSPAIEQWLDAAAAIEEQAS